LNNRRQAYALTIPISLWHFSRTFTGRFHIEIILHFSPGDVITASRQRPLSLDKAVPAGLAILIQSQFVPVAGLCQHSFGWWVKRDRRQVTGDKRQVTGKSVPELYMRKLAGQENEFRALQTIHDSPFTIPDSRSPIPDLLLQKW